MKKQLLTGAFLLASIFAVQAQEVVSFETAEGYEAGDINGQEEWGVTGAAGVAHENQEITDERSSNGEMSLRLSRFDGAAANALVGVFSPVFDEVEEVSFKFFIDVDEDVATDGADYDFIFQADGEELLTTRMKFIFDNSIAILDLEDPTDPDTADFLPVEGVEWTADTWHTLKIVYDFAGETVEYFLDGTSIYESGVHFGTSVNQFVAVHDNFAGSDIYIDQLTFGESAAGVNEALASKLSVFPNPASNVINVASAENVLVNGIEIADLNGRTVKNVKFNGVAEASVNIADLAAGVYMMTISSDKGTATKKIVKN